MDKYYFEGLKFKLLDKTSGREELKEFILAETHEKGYVFQIICISGYYAGRLMGYITVEKEAEEHRVRGITEKHLRAELKKNFIFDENTLEIMTSFN